MRFAFNKNALNRGRGQLNMPKEESVGESMPNVDWGTIYGFR